MDKSVVQVINVAYSNNLNEKNNGVIQQYIVASDVTLNREGYRRKKEEAFLMYYRINIIINNLLFIYIYIYL